MLDLRKSIADARFLCTNYEAQFLLGFGVPRAVITFIPEHIPLDELLFADPQPTWESRIVTSRSIYAGLGSRSVFVGWLHQWTNYITLIDRSSGLFIGEWRITYPWQNPEPQEENLAASWSEDGRARLHDFDKTVLRLALATGEEGEA